MTCYYAIMIKMKITPDSWRVMCMNEFQVVWLVVYIVVSLHLRPDIPADDYVISVWPNTSKDTGRLTTYDRRMLPHSPPPAMSRIGCKTQHTLYVRADMGALCCMTGSCWFYKWEQFNVTFAALQPLRIYIHKRCITLFSRFTGLYSE